MYNSIKVNDIQPLHDHVLVADMNFGQRTTSSGLILMSDDMRTAGIRPRWSQVYAVGPKQADIQVGQWILVTHGRWTRGVKIEDEVGEKTIRRIDTNDILMVSDDEPVDDNISTAILSDHKERW
jgi:co-chaperonin GroES (HSP10)